MARRVLARPLRSTMGITGIEMRLPLMSIFTRPQFDTPWLRQNMRPLNGLSVLLGMPRVRM
jgi:hypothetical protein